MSKPHFLMLAGLPAAGKTTYAKEYEYDDYCVISSDGIRSELYGDESVQGNSSEVFGLAGKRIRECLREGENVVFDATNIKRKDRRNILSYTGKIPCHKECRLLVTPIDVCKRRNAYRERKVPDYVFDKMLRAFQIPDKAEGFDDIGFVWYPEKFRHPLAGVGNLDDFAQDSRWHTESLGQHERNARNYIREHQEELLKSGTNVKLLEKAAKMHDIGKIFTKEFRNSKGETDTNAHYYGHEDYGAYLMLSICNWEINGEKPMEFSVDEWVYMAKLVNWHTRAHEWEKNGKMEAKDRTLLGDAAYFDIKALQEADSNAKVPAEPKKDEESKTVVSRKRREEPEQ